MALNDGATNGLRRLAVAVADRVPDRLAVRFGTGGVGARVVRPVLNRLVGDGLAVVTVRSGHASGLRLAIDRRGEKFYWTGLHERPVQELFVELIRSGSVVWDVGAHRGFFSLLAARLAGPEGRVHAFEPAPATARTLRESVGLNGLDNVTVHELAVAGHEGEAVLNVRPATAMSTLDGDAGGDPITVRCSTLDALLAELGEPDLVKIDAEGAEGAILSAAQDLLHGRSAVLVEAHDEIAEEIVRRSGELAPARTVERVGERHWLLR